MLVHNIALMVTVFLDLPNIALLVTVFLDLPNPWQAVGYAKQVLKV